jgi:LPXTG-motif cell wall-anchored protein
MLNPYYTTENLATASTTAAKTENTTGTASYSFYETMASRANSNAKNVTQYLGNNGKLTLNRPEISNVKVTKEWATTGTEGDSVTVRLYASGTVQKSGSTATSNGVWCLGEKTLTASDKESENWTAMWNALPKQESIGGYTYTYNNYYIREVSVKQKNVDTISKYNVSYKDSYDQDISVTTLSLTTPNADFRKVHPVLDSDTTVTAAIVTDENLTIENALMYNLPNSGGEGAEPYYIAGVMLLMIGSTAMLLSKSKRKEE